MYHASGAASLVFECEDPAGMAPCDTQMIGVAATPLTGTEVSGLSYWPDEDAFLWSQAGPNSALYLVTAAGSVTSLGTVGFSVSDVAIVEIPTPCPPGDEFLRGDSNDDSSINIADVIFTLASLFVSGSPLPVCPDAADFNDDGGLNIADAIYLLGTLFVGGAPTPPPPYPDCGMDGTTNDPLDCPQSACP